MFENVRGLLTVKEWFFDKTNEDAKAHGILLCGEYKDGMLDHTIMRVEQVLGESEKAINVVLDAETFGGTFNGWKTWIPKSVIEYWIEC